MSAARRFLNTARLPRLDFEDPRAAFGHKSTSELLRALLILRLCGVRFLVDHSLPILKWLDRLGCRPVLRRTLYRQFVGGANPEELQTCTEGVHACGMRCMLAATMEEDVGEKSGESVYDSNCSRILSALKMASGDQPMIQLKLSGLLPADLIVRLGQEFESTGNDKLKMIKILGERIENKNIQRLKCEETNTEILQKALQRLSEIGQVATDRAVRVLVDAEQTYLNPGLSALTLAAVFIFNRREPVFWNTYQCYLKDTWENLQFEFRIITETFGCHFGAKVVRGAYLLQERIHAKNLGLPDPTCPTYEATCLNYDRVVDFLLERTSKLGNRSQFSAATHNENSIRRAINRIRELGVDTNLIVPPLSVQFVGFGGIAVTCPPRMPSFVGTHPAGVDGFPGNAEKAAAAGFAVYKSIPYGTVKEVLPYLARRAVENRSVLEGARTEPRLLAAEIRRRLRLAP